MTEFPVIHTNFWDAVLAVPVIIIVTQLIKIFLPIPRAYIPALASFLGLMMSVFYSHRHNLWAGLFMGFFYGSAAIGSYSSLKTSILAYRNGSGNKKKKTHP
ncbi:MULTISPECIES: hypothetical protein [Bacillaceae]|uniref:Holin n=1 Tax=Metabacillus sediminis TaxID=3117746 RepID=A0ABZ2NFU4_9BACI|nr:hypothetical protein [Bacillus sp. SJS]KZZ84838.1 hypothetical protein AS29_007185 [Bacillus sp. SJS]